MEEVIYLEKKKTHQYNQNPEYQGILWLLEAASACMIRVSTDTAISKSEKIVNEHA